MHSQFPRVWALSGIYVRSQSAKRASFLADVAPTVVVVPQLVALRQATPDSPEFVQLVPTPPPSDRELFVVVESAVQTDDVGFPTCGVA